MTTDDAIPEKERGIHLALEWLKWLDTRPRDEQRRMARHMTNLMEDHINGDR